MARFNTGDGVRVLFDIVSDGTVPVAARGERILSAGEEGYVRQNGVQLLEETVYDVFFPHTGRLVGCREKELLESTAPWTPPRWAKGDAIRTACALTHGGRPLAPAGIAGIIGPVLYHRAHGYVYEVTLAGMESLCLLTERQITEH